MFDTSDLYSAGLSFSPSLQSPDGHEPLANLYIQPAHQSGVDTPVQMETSKFHGYGSHRPGVRHWPSTIMS